MKNFRKLLVCLLLLLPWTVQAQQNLFKKYSDVKGVSSIYISKAMLDMNPSLFTKDIYIGEVASKLNSVQVLSTMNSEIKAELLKDIRALVKSSRYELLMKQKGNVSSSEFYASRKGDKVRELVMLTNGAATLKFVYIEGDMTTKDVQKLLLYQDTSENVSPYGCISGMIWKNGLPNARYGFGESAENFQLGRMEEVLEGHEGTD